MMGWLWTERTLSERTALLFLVLGAIWRLSLALVGEGPVDSAPEIFAVIAALVSLTAFALLAVPVAIVILFRGGADFASPRRRALDRLLPSLVLAATTLALAAG